jgi:hypothetical protein
MDWFLPTCSACKWEGDPADVAEVAAMYGALHMAQAHSPVMLGGDVSYIRIFPFRTFKVTGTVTLSPPQPEPQAAPLSPAELAAGKPIKPTRPASGRERK